MIVGLCEADYVGDRIERKNTSGNFQFIGENPISQASKRLLEQGCFTSHLLSFDNNKVLKIINWIC